MMEFAVRDSAVNREMATVDFGEMLDDLDEEEVKEALDWMSKLERNEKTEQILPNSRNVEVILSNGPFKGTLGFDSFRNTEVIIKDLPWRKRELMNKEYEPWKGQDDKQLPHYLGVTYDIYSGSVVKNALAEVVYKNSFHPVKKYLEALKWDGEKRLERLFIDYLGAVDYFYTKEITKKMFTAAVKRIYEPGCKFDEMLVLVGPQGCGKSTILSKMGKQWFTDSIRKFDPKEAGEHLQGAWIVEIGELAAMKKTEIEEVKQFLSKVEDRYRVAYDRAVSDFPRKCIFFGTTNNKNFLHDPTGNRRFWPLEVGINTATKNIFKDLDTEIDQLWAEALHYYKQGESISLSEECYLEAVKQQEDHFEIDAREGLIADYLRKPLPDDWGSLDLIERREYLEDPTGEIERRVTCVAEIWEECLNLNINSLKSHEAKPIAAIVRRLPDWEDRKPSRKRFARYGSQRAFVKID